MCCEFVNASKKVKDAQLVCAVYISHIDIILTSKKSVLRLPPCMKGDVLSVEVVATRPGGSGEGDTPLTDSSVPSVRGRAWLSRLESEGGLTNFCGGFVK